MNRNMQAINWAMAQRQLDPGQFRLLIMLAGRVGKRNFEVWPSYQTMAEDSRIGRSTARRYVDDLCNLGLLERAGVRTRSDGARSSNVYCLKVTAVAVVAEDNEEEDDYGNPPIVGAQIEHGGARSYGQGAMLTGEHSNEPLPYRTSDIEHPLGPQGGEPDLFGKGDQPPLPPEPNVGAEAERIFREKWSVLVSLHGLIPDIHSWTEKRHKALASCLKAAGANDNVEAAERAIRSVLQAIDAAPFYCGENDRQWTVKPDWVLRPHKFIELIEKRAQQLREAA